MNLTLPGGCPPLKIWLQCRLEHALLKLAAHLPPIIRYWIVIDAAAKATTGVHASTVVPELTVIELLERISPYRKPTM